MIHVKSFKSFIQIKDLENLSGIALYTGDLPPITSGGFQISKKEKSSGIDWSIPNGYEGSDYSTQFNHLDKLSNIKPLGSISELKKGSGGNLINPINEHLQERFDASHHDETDLHVNYDLLNFPLSEKKKFKKSGSHFFDLFDNSDE